MDEIEDRPQIFRVRKDRAKHLRDRREKLRIGERSWPSDLPKTY